NDIGDDFNENSHHLHCFSLLDDHDIMASVKVWQNHDDFILSTLCRNLITRNLYKVEITNDVPDLLLIEEKKERIIKHYKIAEKDISYFIFTDSINNMAYKIGSGSINILKKNGNLED